MRRPLSLVAGTALVLLAACQPSKPQPLTAADSAAINKGRTDYMAGWNAGNVDAVVGLYAADGENQAPDMPAAKGADAIRNYFNKAMGTPTRPRLDIVQGTLIGRQDLAVLSGTFTLTPPAPAATAAPTRGAAPAPAAPIAGKYLTALTKGADGSWKITVHAMSYDAPLTPPAPEKPAARGGR